MNELDEVAALLSALDLVISPCTAVRSLAGAVGVPVWLLISWNLSWERFGTESLPLFPDMRPMWLRPNQTWDDVLETIAVKLREEIARP